MSDTLFAYLKGAISNANDTDPEQSSYFYGPPWQMKQNVIYYSRETISLDEDDTYTIPFLVAATAASGWVGVMARVVGDAKLTTVGLDISGLAITGVTYGYGTDRHPGMISLITDQVTSYVFTGAADDTTVEYIIMTLAQDDQL